MNVQALMAIASRVLELINLRKPGDPGVRSTSVDGGHAEALEKFRVYRSSQIAQFYFIFFLFYVLLPAERRLNIPVDGAGAAVFGKS